jgi:hypothetical protein
MSVFFLLIVRFGCGSDRCGVPMSCAYRSPPEVAQAIAKTEINALRYLCLPAPRVVNEKYPASAQVHYMLRD